MNGWRIVRLPVALGRRLGAGRNPLRRAVDRVESVAVLLAIVVAVVAVPFALKAGTAVDQANLVQGRVQAANTITTTAVLLQDAPTTTGLDAGMGPVTTLGRWRAPGGAERTGQVTAVPGQKAGATVPVWTDRSGALASQPLTADQAFWRGMLTDIVVMFGMLCVLGGALGVLRWRLNRRRYTAWDADWRETEPRWTQRAR